MSKAYQVKVVRGGIITLPKQLRAQNKIEDGDMLTLMQLSDGVVVIRQRRFGVNELVNKLAKEWQDSGESLESMLRTLRRVRAEDGPKKS